MTRFTVPLLDANLVDVTVTAWRHAPGDPVEKGELVAEVTTDKAVFDLECPCDGTLLEIFAPVKSIVPVGTVIALVGEPGESDPEIPAFNRALREKAARESGAEPAAKSGAVPAPAGSAHAAPGGADAASGDAGTRPAAGSAAPGTASAATVRATPKARRLAAAQGIDLAAVAAATRATVVTEAILSQYLSTRT